MMHKHQLSLRSCCSRTAVYHRMLLMGNANGSHAVISCLALRAILCSSIIHPVLHSIVEHPVCMHSPIKFRARPGKCREGGFFLERWGDAPVHSLGAALFLNRSQVCQSFAVYPLAWHEGISLGCTVPVIFLMTCLLHSYYTCGALCMSTRSQQKQHKCTLNRVFTRT